MRALAPRAMCANAIYINRRATVTWWCVSRADRALVFELYFVGGPSSLRHDREELKRSGRGTSFYRSAEKVCPTQLDATRLGDGLAGCFFCILLSFSGSCFFIIIIMLQLHVFHIEPQQQQQQPTFFSCPWRTSVPDERRHHNHCQVRRSREKDE